MLVYIMAVVNCVFVALLLLFRIKDNLKGVAIVQPIGTILSMLIVLVNWLQTGGRPEYCAVIFISMGIALLGDFLNIDMDVLDKVLRGLLIACIAYLVYGIGITALNGFHWPDIVTGLVLVGVNGYSVKILSKKAGDMKVPVAIYSCILAFLAWRGLSMLFGSYLAIGQAVLLALGAVSLYLGDLEFGFHLFHKKRKTLLGPLLYAGGQLLIALSTIVLI